jgi:hypothetical protein
VVMTHNESPSLWGMIKDTPMSSTCLAAEREAPASCLLKAPHGSIACSRYNHTMIYNHTMMTVPLWMLTPQSDTSLPLE